MALLDGIRNRVRPRKEMSEDETSSTSSTHSSISTKTDASEEVHAVVANKDDSILEVINLKLLIWTICWAK